MNCRPWPPGAWAFWLTWLSFIHWCAIRVNIIHCQPWLLAYTKYAYITCKTGVPFQLNFQNPQWDIHMHIIIVNQVTACMLCRLFILMSQFITWIVGKSHIEFWILAGFLPVHCYGSVKQPPTPADHDEPILKLLSLELIGSPTHILECSYTYERFCLRLIMLCSPQSSHSVASQATGADLAIKLWFWPNKMQVVLEFMTLTILATQASSLYSSWRESMLLNGPRKVTALFFFNTPGTFTTSTETALRNFVNSIWLD